MFRAYPLIKTAFWPIEAVAARVRVVSEADGNAMLQYCQRICNASINQAQASLSRHYRAYRLQPAIQIAVSFVPKRIKSSDKQQQQGTSYSI